MHREPIVGVQYLRGIAVLAVVISHGASFASGGLHVAPLLDGRLDEGRLGVDMFFQISGFIIAVVSLCGRDLAPAIGIGDFFRRRFTRIVPLMWVAVLLFAALQWLGHVHGQEWGYVRAMLLLPGPLVPAIVWTLREELIFYIIFAISFLTGGWWRALPILWCAAILLVPHGPGTLTTHDSPLALLLNQRNLGFVAGLLVAVLWFRRSNQWRFRSPVEPLVVLALGGALVMFCVVPGLGLDSGIAIASVLLPLLLFAAHVECPHGVARRIGEMFGNASYAIYLFHYPAISVAVALCRRLAPETSVLLLTFVCTIVGAGAGVAAHFLLERPLIAAARRWLPVGGRRRD